MELRVRDLTTAGEFAISPKGALVSVPSRLSQDGQLLAYIPSQTGKQVSYVMEQGGASERQLCVRQNLTSGHLIAIIENPSMPILDCDLSPDDKWLSLLVEKPPGDLALRIAPVRTTPTPEKDWIPVLDPSVWISSPRWSHSGDALFFLRELDDPTPGSCLEKPAGEPVVFYHAHNLTRCLIGPRWGRNFAVAKDQIIANLAQVTGNTWMGKWT